jgi:polygalacturonase
MISVTDPPYNAKGDGTTPDADKIQAAINAANGNDTVYFPQNPLTPTPGVTKYLVEKSLVLPGGTRLVGASRQVQMFARVTGDLIQVSGPHSAISHLGFSSEATNRTGAYIRNWHSPSPTDIGNYLMISDCHF